MEFTNHTSRYAGRIRPLLEHPVDHVLHLVGGQVDQQKVGPEADPGISWQRLLKTQRRPALIEEGRCDEQRR